MKPMVMANTDAEFEAADQAVWTEMARRILKGAAPDSLDRTNEDGSKVSDVKFRKALVAGLRNDLAIDR